MRSAELADLLLRILDRAAERGAPPCLHLRAEERQAHDQPAPERNHDGEERKSAEGRIVRRQRGVGDDRPQRNDDEADDGAEERSINPRPDEDVPSFDVAVALLDRKGGERDEDGHHDEADAKLDEEIKAELGLRHR